MVARARASAVDARPDPGGWAQSGPYDSTRVARHQRVAGDPPDEEDPRGVPNNPDGPKTTRSRSLVSRRAIVDIVRAATLGSYGVIGFSGGGLVGRLGERLGLAPHEARRTRKTSGGRNRNYFADLVDIGAPGSAGDRKYEHAPHLL